MLLNLCNLITHNMGGNSVSLIPMEMPAGENKPPQVYKSITQHCMN